MELYDRPPSELLLPGLRPDNHPPAAAEERITYFDQPMIKPPSWRWFIPTYFWLGGVAGGAAVIGAAAHFLGGRGARETVRHARYLSLPLAVACPILLIADLKRPERFFRMLRVFKVSSPLSVGTWILSAFGLVSGALAVRQAVEDEVIVRRDSQVGRLARRLTPEGPLTAAHGLLGMGLGGYTGVLLGVTAVPVWAAGGVLMGPLFEATSLASGAGALTLLGIAFGKRDHASAHARKTVEAVEAASTVAQLALVAGREAVVTRRINRPLSHGRWGALYRIGAVGGGMATPLTLRIVSRFLGPGAARTLSGVSAACSVVGALVERFAIVESGKVSARDPLAYQDTTAGAPGAARPSAVQQALNAPQTSAFKPHVAAGDTHVTIAQ